MARTALRGNVVETAGELPAEGVMVPSFLLAGTDLSDRSLSDFEGKNVVFNIFPSIDTSVCAASVRRFNQEASGLENTVVLCISADLPFAHERFCEIEGLKDVIPLSVFRSPEFGTDYGVLIKEGPMRGLLARAIVVADSTGKVIYTQLAPEITEEPDYESALAALS